MNEEKTNKGEENFVYDFFGRNHDFIATQRIGRTNVGYDTIPRQHRRDRLTLSIFTFPLGLSERTFLYVIHVTKRKKQ